MNEAFHESDAELFSRVWQRVMPEGGPLLLSEETDLTPSQPESQPPAAALPPTETLPLTTASPETLSFLRERIEVELKNASSTRHLHNRWGGPGVLCDLSARCHKRARRLAAALLLLSGVWYLPESQSSPRRWPDVRSSLRGLFHTFQRDSVLYAAVAEHTQDTLLAELLLELSGESIVMRDTVRRILER